MCIFYASRFENREVYNSLKLYKISKHIIRAGISIAVNIVANHTIIVILMAPSKYGSN